MQAILFDGIVIAVKQLSSKSKQGSREFVNEIGIIIYNILILLDCMDVVLKEINYSWYMNTWKTIAWHVLCLVSSIFLFAYFISTLESI